MKFEWDEAKRRRNLERHGLDFRDAWRLCSLPVLSALDDREDYDEERWLGMGFLDPLVVVIAFPQPTDGIIRVISMRKALTHEREHYEQHLRDQLGQA